MADVFPEVGQVVLTSLLSLAAMFIFTRAGGKRQIAQMSPFDYLNAVTVGSIGAELATNLEQWWRPFSALVVYGLVTWFVHYTAWQKQRYAQPLERTQPDFDGRRCYPEKQPAARCHRRERVPGSGPRGRVL